MSSSPANTSPRRWALIADERSSYFHSWNATTIAHTRGSRQHPYPPPSSVWTRANTTKNCDEDFSDLAVNNFVLSHKVTARRKLERLQGSVFARSLLERGTYHAMEGIEARRGLRLREARVRQKTGTRPERSPFRRDERREERDKTGQHKDRENIRSPGHKCSKRGVRIDDPNIYNGPIEVLMGYTSSVGVMLAEEIALTNDVVGAVSITTRGTVARLSELEDTVRGLEMIVHQLKRSHELLRIYTEMELANRDLSIGLLRAHLNTVAPMEIDLTTMEEEEYVSAPGTPPTSGHTSTTDISIRVETPELAIPEGVLIPIEDSSEEEEGEIALEPVGIILPMNTFNWQDEQAQGREEYYC
ncbi:hypothetical protein BDM02DRAFT_3132347 [Thelephora ganbajun]|uniref:Uncharacterized protein n=1 Tax=Thelephora ganbajun TaxID=370292 RepID=A0ACB6Z209_THEGA|nr:hypothetical protein BDM02DRAFT_3132347 [Thelephora ganbajun]